MANVVRASLVCLVVGLVAVLPVVWYRAAYAHGKRLREVVPGHFYRSGQMTAEGFADAFQRLGIRTVINVQDDYPDPDLDLSYWNRHTIKESAFCMEQGVRYIALAPDLVGRRSSASQQPVVIDEFLAIMDDPANYPVLIHCKAGLHRTGCLSAVYRMEYQGWSNVAAYEELKAHGFGEWACSSANDYVQQYVLNYRRRDHGVASVGR